MAPRACPGENVIKDLKCHGKCHGGLAHLPLGQFAANATWLTLTAIAYNLGRQTLLVARALNRPGFVGGS